MFFAIRLLISVAWFGFTLWLVGSSALFFAMQLPPTKFAKVVSYVPAPVTMMALPFRPLWTFARRGNLQLGDQAPEFDLARQDKSGRAKLTEHMGKRPVVLVFGSYT